MVAAYRAKKGLLTFPVFSKSIKTNLKHMTKNLIYTKEISPFVLYK